MGGTLALKLPPQWGIWWAEVEPKHPVPESKNHNGKPVPSACLQLPRCSSRAVQPVLSGKQMARPGQLCKRFSGSVGGPVSGRREGGAEHEP